VSEQPAHPQDSEDATAADAPAPLQPDEAPTAADSDTHAEEPTSDAPAEETDAEETEVPAEAAEPPAGQPTVVQAAIDQAPKAVEAPDAAETPSVADGNEAPPQPGAESAPRDEESGGAAAIVQDKPEIAVGAAFAGGLVLALILKRLAR
jgi:hypothetical protein